MALEGASCTRHPIKAAMDPARGRWLLVGSEQGLLYAFNLSVANVGPSGVLLPELQAALFSAAGESSVHDAAVYCVAWNSKLHLVAACSRHSEGHTVVLCGMPGDHARCEGISLEFFFDQLWSLSGANSSSWYTGTGRFLCHTSARAGLVLEVCVWAV
jgi:hypothetical protein